VRGTFILPSGGKRAGAGRKKTLDAWERLEVGMRCEALWNEAKTQASDNSSAKFHAQSDIDQTYKRAQSVPIPQRAAWIASEQGQQYLDDVEVERLALAGMLDSSRLVQAPRLFAIPHRRPYGRRSSIVSQIAVEESANRSLPISQHLVRECWEEVRRIVRDARKSEAV
jgi:hypothetical protein